MGAGFAIYLPQDDAEKAIEIANNLGFKAIIAGRVEDGPSQVVIASKDIIFSGDTLEVRG